MTTRSLHPAAANEQRRRQVVSTLGLASTTDDGESPGAAAVARDAEGLRRRLRRLALDVHDGPMQSLIAAGFGLSDLKRHADAESVELVDRLDEIAAELAGAERS